MSWATHAKLTRRCVMAGTAGVGLSALLQGRRVLAADASVEAVIDRLLGGRKAEESNRVSLDLPSAVNYGNTVPLAVAVTSPMAAADYVQSVHVFAEGNPFPEVATFYFTPENGPARVQTRIRLDEGKHKVWAIAKLSDGSTLSGGRDVVTEIGGCSADSGIPPGYVMPAPRPRIKVAEHAEQGTLIEVRAMISHIMETGLRTDTAGNPLPRRIIHRMECNFGGRRVFTATLSPAIAANAYLNFAVKIEQTGMIEFTWHEDGGAMYRTEQRVTVV